MDGKGIFLSTLTHRLAFEWWYLYNARHNSSSIRIIKFGYFFCNYLYLGVTFSFAFRVSSVKIGGDDFCMMITS